MAPAIRGMMRNMDGMFRVLRLFFGEQESNRGLSQTLTELLDQIPNEYREEMTGKIMGYNSWLATHHPEEKSLTIEKIYVDAIAAGFAELQPVPKFDVA